MGGDGEYRRGVHRGARHTRPIADAENHGQRNGHGTGGYPALPVYLGCIARRGGYDYRPAANHTARLIL